MVAAAAPFEALERTLEARRQEVERALRGLVRAGDSPAVAAAVDDALFAPAKRLRPVLALMVADALRGDAASVLPAAFNKRSAKEKPWGSVTPLA